MPSAQNPSSWQYRARDLALVIGGCVLDLVAFSKIMLGPAELPPWVPGYAAAGFLPLLWRRRAPRAVFAIVWVHAAFASFGIPSYGPIIGLLIALYTVATRCSRRDGLWALALSFVPAGFLVAGEALNAPPEYAISALASSITVLSLANTGAWSLGRWAHAQREQLALLERQRESAAHEAVTRERTTIARDLHDVISHSVGVMTLQAAGARRVLAAGKGDRAARALADIEHAGTQAMTELRFMLNVLRVGSDRSTEPSPTAPGNQPHPGLADLDALLNGVLAAGVPARLVVHGDPRHLDPGTDLSAYRIVQEALTNVAKHAGPGVPTTVELRWNDRELQVSVKNAEPDRPPPHPPGSPGFGLIGLRERASAVGGRLDAGDRPGGGFHVTATLPTTNAAPATEVEAGRSE